MVYSNSWRKIRQLQWKLVNCVVHFVYAWARFNAKFARLPKSSAKESEGSLLIALVAIMYITTDTSRCCAVPQVLSLTILQSWNYLNSHTVEPSFYQKHFLSLSQSIFWRTKLTTTSAHEKSDHHSAWVESESAFLAFGKLDKFQIFADLLN